MGVAHTYIYPTPSEVKWGDTNSKIAVLIGKIAVGKTTLFKSICDSQINEQNEIKILKNLQKECVSSILYLYYETLNRLTSHKPAAKTNFYNQTYESITYIRQNLHIQNCIMGKRINYIWNLRETQETFYNHVSCNSNIDYFLEKAEIIMNPMHQLCYDEHIRIYTKCAYKTINEIDDDENNIKYIDNIKKDVNILRKIKCDCIVYMVALNNYCNASTNLLFDDVCEFRKIYQYARSNNMQKHKQIPVILVLNKTDLLKTHLKFRSLKQLFGNEYNGRNYNERLNSVIIIRRILNEISMSLKVFIPIDIVHIMHRFCGDFFDNYWLDLCCNDGIKYIKNQFLCAKRDNIYCYQFSAVKKADVKLLLNDISIIVNSI